MTDQEATNRYDERLRSFGFDAALEAIEVAAQSYTNPQGDMPWVLTRIPIVSTYVRDLLGSVDPFRASITRAPQLRDAITTVKAHLDASLNDGEDRSPTIETYLDLILDEAAIISSTARMTGNARTSSEVNAMRKTFRNYSGGSTVVRVQSGSMGVCRMICALTMTGGSMFCAQSMSG